MDDDFGNTYENTVEFLNYIYKLYNSGRIPCKPSFKIIEDGLIVGILTQTNQFVPISKPVLDTFGDNIPSINNLNYTSIDKVSITNTNVDEERIKYIKDIKLETNFYNMFRNTIKTLLSTFKHRKIRQDIESDINSPTLLYLNKLRNIEKLLRELTINDIVFTNYSSKKLYELDEITSCFMNSIETCNTKKFCLSDDNGECKLSIPKKNQINRKDNEKIYFGRMADELIRYSRIKSFMFKTNSFLSFAELKYNLRDNEIILLHSQLTQDYFDDMIIAYNNPYIKYNTYDDTQPIITQSYTNVVEKQKIIENDEQQYQCKKPTITTINGKWKSLLPVNSRELIFNDEQHICSFDIILTLIKQIDSKNRITHLELKEILATEYNKLYEKNATKILAILTSQGKGNMSKKLMNGELTIESMIINEEYYATNIDIWILAVKFNVPIIFISSTKLIENDKHLLVANPDKSDTYFFIKSPGVRKDNIPQYRLMISPSNNSQIQITELNTDLQVEIRENKINNALAEFIENFIPSKILIRR